MFMANRRYHGTTITAKFVMVNCRPATSILMTLPESVWLQNGFLNVIDLRCEELIISHKFNNLPWILDCLQEESRREFLWSCSNSRFPWPDRTAHLRASPLSLVFSDFGSPCLKAFEITIIIDWPLKKN